MARLQKVPDTPEAENAERAEITLNPAVNGAAVVLTYDGKFGKQDFAEIMGRIDEQFKSIQNGEMENVEAMLFAQATALQSIFVDLAIRAHAQDHLSLTQTLLTLALKAQAQCRTTLETLSEVKNPRC